MSIKHVEEYYNQICRQYQEMCKVGIEYKSVETLHEDINSEGLDGCLPRMFLLSFGIIKGKDG